MLQKIITQKKTEVANLSDIPLATLTPATHDFAQALHCHGLAVIAELKAHSPTQGCLSHDYDPLVIALRYQAANANALSVLTDTEYFAGKMQDIATIRSHITLPILCKDFMIDPKQVLHARAAGADACLLIVAVLSNTELIALKTVIEQWSMTAIFEVFNQQELERALACNARVIQINNRDLQSFSVNLENCQKLCKHIPADVTVIAASGILQPADVQQFPQRINACLIGTALMQAENPANFIKQLQAHYAS